MKIRAERPLLADTLTWVAQAIQKRPNIPILAGVRLAASEGVLTISGYDYEISHTARLTAEVISEGECVVSGHFLRDIVASLRGASVELVVDGSMLTITAGRSTYRTQVMRGDDYPTLPTLPTPVGTLPAEVLAYAITTCKAPIEDVSPTEGLRGLHVEADGNEVVFVGMRSSVGIEFTAEWAGTPFACTVPIKMIEPATRGLSGDVTIGHEGGTVGLSDGRRSVTMRTFDHVYVAWRKAIRPAADDLVEALVDVDALAEIVKRAGSLSDDKVPLVLSVDHGEILVEVQGAEHAGADAVAAEANGETRVGMAPKFLLEALNAMPAGQVRLGFGSNANGRLTPVMVRPVHTDDRVAFVAPRRLPGDVR